MTPITLRLSPDNAAYVSRLADETDLPVNRIVNAILDAAREDAVKVARTSGAVVVKP